MSAQVDGTRLHVDVHQVVDDLALDVVLDAVDQEAAPDVDHFDEREVPVGQRGSRGDAVSNFLWDTISVGLSDQVLKESGSQDDLLRVLVSS